MALIFLLNIAWIMAHELDAIQQEEWRFFNLPFALDDELAYRIFTILHVPLFIAIMFALDNTAFQIGMNIFLIAHAILHWLLRNHPQVNFNNGFSRLLIFAPVPTAIWHLIWLYSLS